MRTASGAVLSIVLGLCLGLGLAVFQECADSMPPLFAVQAPKPIIHIPHDDHDDDPYSKVIGTGAQDV